MLQDMHSYSANGMRRYKITCFESAMICLASEGSPWKRPARSREETRKHEEGSSVRVPGGMCVPFYCLALAHWTRPPRSPNDAAVLVSSYMIKRTNFKREQRKYDAIRRRRCRVSPLIRREYIAYHSDEYGKSYLFDNAAASPDRRRLQVGGILTDGAVCIH